MIMWLWPGRTDRIHMITESLMAVRPSGTTLATLGGAKA
jgi:hypothetical protein